MARKGEQGGISSIRCARRQIMILCLLQRVADILGLGIDVKALAIYLETKFNRGK
jgi:hypothetical protein